MQHDSRETDTSIATHIRFPASSNIPVGFWSGSWVIHQHYSYGNMMQFLILCSLCMIGFNLVGSIPLPPDLCKDVECQASMVCRTFIRDVCRHGCMPGQLPTYEPRCVALPGKRSIEMARDSEKAGRCPGNAASTFGACVIACDTDASCSGTQLCCVNGCGGRLCMDPE